PSQEFTLVSTSQSQASEPQQTQAASSQASSAQETQDASAAKSSVSESKADSTEQSTVNYEQKWKSSHGIIKSQSTALSKANSEVLQFKSAPVAAVASTVAS